MPESNRGIGSEGLEQGGPNLGNDYARPDLSTRNAGDSLTTPDTSSLKDDEGDKDSLTQGALDTDAEDSKNYGNDAGEDDDDEDDEDYDEELVSEDDDEEDSDEDSVV